VLLGCVLIVRWASCTRLLAVEGPARALDTSLSAKSESTAGWNVVCRRVLPSLQRAAARIASTLALEVSTTGVSAIGAEAAAQKACVRLHLCEWITAWQL